jgi:hypothetical protein
VGTTTIFEGAFQLDRPLRPEHAEYLLKFSRTRRMQRNPEIAATLPDPLRERVGLPIGVDGGYFVGSTAAFGQDWNHPSVLDGSQEPAGQPGLWCQWVPTEDRTSIHWDGREKFYDWTEWLRYIVEHFLTPWGYTLRGAIEFRNYHRQGIVIADADGVNEYDDDLRAHRRVSRSGKPYYGTPDIRTHRPDDALERRRVRSLVAHERRALGLDPHRYAPVMSTSGYRRARG